MKNLMLLMAPLLIVMANSPVLGWVNADINGDEFVDLADASGLTQDWQQPGPLLPGNINNDGAVDKSDLVDLSANWLQEMHSLPVGVDLMQTTFAALDFTIEPLPPDFFNPGSEPFFGIVELQGAPIGTFGAFETGTTDTVVHRAEHSLLRTPPDAAQIDIEIVALSLVSIAPIEVNTFTGTEFWDVEVQLVPSEPGSSNLGQMDIQTIDPVIGVCDMAVPVELAIVFIRQGFGDTRVLPLSTELVGNAGNITDVLNSTAASLLVPFLSTAFGISINLDSPVLHMACDPAQFDPGRPGPIIDPGATVDPGVGSLGRFCHLYTGSSVGPGVVVGPLAQIRQNSQINADTLVGEFADIGPDCNVGPGALIGSNTSLGALCQVGPGAIVGPGCVLGDGVIVGANAEVGPGSSIGNGTFVGQDTTISFGANIGQNCAIDDGLFLASEALVPAGEHLTEGLFKCSEPLSGNYTGTSSECEDAGGVVSCASDKLSVSELSSSTHDKQAPGTEVVPVPTDPCDPNTPDWVTEAIEDLKENTHHDPCSSTTSDPNIPIPDRDYDPNADGYTCGDFAHDAERGLSEISDPCDPNSKKYDNVTITYYWKYKPNPAYKPAQGDKKGNRKWLSDGAHALIDIHKDGKMVWLEPQTGAAPNPDLDFDDDGKVEYWDNPGKTKPNPPPDSVMSDNNAIIEVYPDRETAEKAGAPTG